MIEIIWIHIYFLTYLHTALHWYADSLTIKKNSFPEHFNQFWVFLLDLLSGKMAEFDLTTRMGQYLDRHLVFPLLEFLSVKEVGLGF